MDPKDYRKRGLWDHQGKMMAYQMYTYGYDDPITAYQILTGEESPDIEVEEEQMDFAGIDDEE